MKTVVLSIITLCMLSLGQVSAQPKLIVRIDDMGSFHSANEACLRSFEDGIATSVELMVVTAWFPEAVRMLHQYTGVDVGLHLVASSEWDLVKWGPLTQCPSLTDANGYFFPKIRPDKAYLGQSLMEQPFSLEELEKEYRAQIELGLKNVPQISHLSGHMGSLSFTPQVKEMVQRLASEYGLLVADSMEELSHAGYVGPKKTSAQKEAAFLKMLDNLEDGKTYMFLDHPAFDDSEMAAVGHIGYMDVAMDRQGVTDLMLSPVVRQTIENKGIRLVDYVMVAKTLPRATQAENTINTKKVEKYFDAVRASGLDMHSVMVLQHGKVIMEKWWGNHTPEEQHILNSVSKTFVSTAVGFAVQEGLIKETDKVLSFFPDKWPDTVSDNLKAMEIRHLLTMNCGHDVDPTALVRSDRSTGTDWIKGFLAFPVLHEPGTFFTYNSLGTYMLSAIVQKVTGKRVIDYLHERLFRTLGIAGVTWEESPQGINTGGWGLYVQTEDIAKLGQFYLQQGNWEGKQLLNKEWFERATANLVPSLPAGARPETLTLKPKDSDWLQGYGYQIWRCRHNAYRADGAAGQYIIVIPEKDVVIVTTANLGNMQKELNLIWDYLLPAIK